jgi:hypothetical protein
MDNRKREAPSAVRGIVFLGYRNSPDLWRAGCNTDAVGLPIGVHRNLGWGCSLSSVTAKLRARSRAGGGCGRGSPPPATGVRGYNPGKFLKIQMLAGEF